MPAGLPFLNKEVSSLHDTFTQTMHFCGFTKSRYQVTYSALIRMACESAGAVQLILTQSTRSYRVKN